MDNKRDWSAIIMSVVSLVTSVIVFVLTVIIRLKK